MLRTYLFTSLLLLAGCTPSNDAPAPDISTDATVIYLMRHAEPEYPKEGEENRDPVLNEAGRQRAGDLVELLKDEGVTRILSSNFHRTRETVAPLAEALGLEVEMYNPFELEAFAEILLEQTGHLVIAGHSNTTPKLVELLGGDPGEPIDEQREFDRIYRVTLADESVVTKQFRYGIPSERTED